jgi:hypothetical protein
VKACAAQFARQQEAAMKATFFKGVVLGSVVSLAMLTATAAFAGGGVGAIFNLGQVNAVNGQSRLTGSTGGASQLAVVNTSDAAGATGIGISVANGKPPLAVNSTTKVGKFNADLLDGDDSTAFQKRVSPLCDNGTAITKIGPNGGVDCSTAFIEGMNALPQSGNTAFENFAEVPMRVLLECRDGGSSVEFVVQSLSNEASTLNWDFSQGGSTSTVNASGASIAAFGAFPFVLSASRLEGQWIWANNEFVVTLNVHVFDAGTGCEIRGTAEIVKTAA